MDVELLNIGNTILNFRFVGGFVWYRLAPICIDIQLLILGLPATVIFLLNYLNSILDCWTSKMA